MTFFNKHIKFSASQKILGREQFAKNAQGSKTVEILKRGLLATFLAVVFSQHRVLK